MGLRNIMRRGPGPFIATVLQSGLETVLSYSDENKISALEIGTMYQKAEGFSTYNIANFIRNKYRESTFTSIECSAEHIRNAKSILKYLDESLLDHVDFVHGMSFRELPKLLEKDGPIDFAFIDGGAHPEICLREFEMVLSNLSSNGLIIMDDLQSIAPADSYSARRIFGKGTLVLPYLVIHEYLKTRNRFLKDYGREIDPAQEGDDLDLRTAEHVNKSIECGLISFPGNIAFEIVEELGHEMLIVAEEHVLREYMNTLNRNYKRTRRMVKRLQSGLKMIIKGHR